MAAVLSPHAASQSPSPQPLPPRVSPTSTPNHPISQPDPMTSPPTKTQISRMPSYASKRLSTFSTHSNGSTPRSNPRSRPVSIAFPQFHSSLPYTLVRDFAYPSQHVNHYGPPPEIPSSASTPRSDTAKRRLSDPEPAWERTEPWENWRQSGEQLPSTIFVEKDGPPWSEDEDLASPVVTSSKQKHRKQKSNAISFDETRGRGRHRESDNRRHPSRNGDGNSDNGSRQQRLGLPSHAQGRRDSHFAGSLPNRASAYTEEPASSSPPPSSDSQDDEDEQGPDWETDDSRYSRDYQFTIASPDEEVHGRAVALFDFARENDNELPLAEGQIILVSYRHGQGWLVAQDPKTGECGLVPEEYVRLLRDIEGGLGSLMNGMIPNLELDTTSLQHQQFNNQNFPTTSPGDSYHAPASVTESADARTPTQAEHNQQWSSLHHQTPHHQHTNEPGHVTHDPSYVPHVSTFSTTREDLEPWPSHLLSSPSMTPTSTFPTSNLDFDAVSSKGRRGSEEESGRIHDGSAGKGG